MKIKALVSAFVAVCFISGTVLAQAPAKIEKKVVKAKTEKVEKTADKKEVKTADKKTECDPKTCKDAKNSKKPCCADKKPAAKAEKK